MVMLANLNPHWGDDLGNFVTADRRPRELRDVHNVKRAMYGRGSFELLRTGILAQQ